MPDDYVVVKFDFSNASTCVWMGALLASKSISTVYCHLTYQQISVLKHGQQAVYSEKGVQQGDPVSPLSAAILLGCTSALDITSQQSRCRINERLHAVGESLSIVATDDIRRHDQEQRIIPRS
jgi:hypothetical protein